MKDLSDQCKSPSQKRQILPYAILILIAVPGRADAYLDLGTGSYLLQLLIAGFVGGLYVMKMYWKKAKTYLTTRRSKG